MNSAASFDGLGEPLVSFTKPWLVHTLEELIHRFFLAHVAVRAAMENRHILTAMHPIEMYSSVGPPRRLSLTYLIEALSYPAAREHLLNNTLLDIRASLLRGVCGYITLYGRKTHQTPAIVAQPWYFYLRVARNVASHIEPGESVRFAPALKRQLAKYRLDQTSVTWGELVIREGDAVATAGLNDVDCVRLWTDVADFVESSDLT